MLIAIATNPSRQKRISRKQFEALSRPAQEKYLEDFPKSSHRFLLNGGKRKKKKNEEPIEDVDFEEVESEREEKPTKKDYPVAVQNNLPALRTFHPEAPPLPSQRFKARDKTFDLATMGDEDEKIARRIENELVEKEISKLNSDGAAVINRHSVGAIAKLQPAHMKQVATSLHEKRGEIIDGVAERVEQHPTLFNRGLNALGKIFQGETKLTPKEQRASKRTLVQIAMVGLLACGALAVTAGAGPVAVVAARMLYDVWMGRSKEERGSLLGLLSRKEEDDVSEKVLHEESGGDMAGTEQISAKDFAKGKKKKEEEEEEEEENDEDELDVEPRPKRLSAPKSRVLQLPSNKKKWNDDEAEDAEFEAVAASEMTQEHIDTIHNVLDQLSDLFNHQSVDEVKELGNKMFATASSVYDVYQEVYNAVSPLSNGRLSGRPGKNFFGKFKVGLPQIVNVLEERLDIQSEIERSRNGKITAYHFACDDFLVTVGRFGINQSGYGLPDLVHFIFSERK